MTIATKTTTTTSSSNTRTSSSRRAAASGPIRIPKSAVQAMPVVPDDNNNNSNTAAAAAAAGMQNVNIASILNSTGPIVTAVLLKAGGTRKEKGEKNAVDDNVVEAVQVDTTPRKQMVAEILGGPFTFLGQYEEEGIVLMIRKDQDNHHHEGDSEGTNKHGLERNQHPLQPPFQTSTVWGDILCLKVAPDDEDDGVPEEAEETEDAAMQVTITPTPNDEFFLNYTKEEYLKFAARTDVVYTPPPLDEAAMDDEEEEETATEGASAATNPPKLVEKVDSSDEEDDDGDAPYEMEEQGDQEEDNEEEGDDDEGEEGGFLELLMGQVLQRFEHENGRMPDATELKALEAAITEKLGGMQ